LVQIHSLPAQHNLNLNLQLINWVINFHRGAKLFLKPRIPTEFVNSILPYTVVDPEFWNESPGGEGVQTYTIALCINSYSEWRVLHIIHTVYVNLKIKRGRAALTPMCAWIRQCLHEKQFEKQTPLFREYVFKFTCANFGLNTSIKFTTHRQSYFK